MKNFKSNKQLQENISRIKQVMGILKEQSIGTQILASLSDPSNLDFNMGMSTDVDIKKNYCKTPNKGKNMLIMLFKYCLTISSNLNDPKIKNWNERLYNSMKGIGTNKDFIKVFSEIKTIQELASIYKTFNYEGDNLWQWMSKEMKYSWDDIWNTINYNVKKPANIPICLEYNKNYYDS